MSNKIIKHLTIYSTLLLLITIIFYIFLHRLLGQQNYKQIFVIAVIYGIVSLALGITSGVIMKNKIRETRHDVGLYYHSIAYIIINFTSFVYAIGFQNNELLSFFIGFVAWTIGLVIHFIVTKNTIKGISTKDVFR